MVTQSEEDFDDLFSEMDLNSNNLGRMPEARNTLIVKILKISKKLTSNLMIQY